MEFVLPGNDKGTGEMFPYTYDIRAGNINLRTFQRFSVAADSTMKPCENCPYIESFQAFMAYYGDSDYGDKWILAASFGNGTSYSNTRRETNFGTFSKLGR